MQHKYLFPLNIIITFILSSCMTQAPAPIEYGGKSSSKEQSQIEEIKEEPTIIREKTIWGEKEISDTQNDMPQEAQAPVTSSNIRTTPIAHEVIEGETLDTIAAQYNIDKNEIIKANHLTPPYILEELQIIQIPPNTDPDNLKPLATHTEITEEKLPPVAPIATKHEESVQLPVANGQIISEFGNMNSEGKKNNGINIKAPLGSEIISLSEGVAVFSGNDPKFGNLLIIKSDNNIFMAYSHMSDLIITKGESIAHGQLIGHVGQTGNADSPQLHFAIREGKTAIDPIVYLKKH